MAEEPPEVEDPSVQVDAVLQEGEDHLAEGHLAEGHLAEVAVLLEAEDRLAQEDEEAQEVLHEDVADSSHRRSLGSHSLFSPSMVWSGVVGWWSIPGKTVYKPEWV